ncbi:hypothetical protein FB564_3739 [Salinispora arenicola]|uniref:Uncharacterized protein n=1 Tax=Salinispora arenicola TaxID=168697 RepID=A0A542XRW2_SALAC|nr:hypothetical protein FB564_3739 [Salinispora arenicola]
MRTAQIFRLGAAIGIAGATALAPMAAAQAGPPTMKALPRLPTAVIPTLPMTDTHAQLMARASPASS